MTKRILIIGCGHTCELHRALLREELRLMALEAKRTDDYRESTLGRFDNVVEEVSVIEIKCMDKPFHEFSHRIKDKINTRDHSRETWKFNKQRHNRGLK